MCAYRGQVILISSNNFSMKIPFGWIKEFVPAARDVVKSAEKLTMVGHEVEKIIDRDAAMDKIVVGRIAVIEKHPNADKLRIAKTVIDRSGSPRTIVCGGSNLEEGMLVAVAIPGARVRWHGEGELVEITESEIRGVKSYGMICASEEIGLGEVFPSRDREVLNLTFTHAVPGTAVSAALGMNDPVLEIDVTPNRGDAMSVLGIARELAAAEGVVLKEPKAVKLKLNARDTKVTVAILDKKACPNYIARVIRNVKVGKSPSYVQNRLRSVGIKSINSIVDATNYVMMEMGQPLHAFDANQIAVPGGVHIAVRRAKKGESLRALDEKEYELDESMLVIANAHGPIAIAGVMGGIDSGISEKTTDVVLESALFDSVLVGKTYRKLGLRSESSIRFERGIDPTMQSRALDRVTELVLAWAGGSAEPQSTGAAKTASHRKPISVSVVWVNEFLGTNIKPTQMISILKRLGCKVVGAGNLKVAPPSWRADLNLREDIAEEVARIYGYTNFAPTRIVGELYPGVVHPNWQHAQELRRAFIAMGWAEVLTYSFYGEAMRTPEDHLEVASAMSASQQYLRRSIVPRLVEAAGKNARTHEHVQLFEIGHVFIQTKESLPDEPQMIAGVLLANDDTLAYRLACGAVEQLAVQLGRNAEALVEAATIRVLTSEEKSANKIRQSVAVFECAVEKIFNAPKHKRTFAALSEFPSVERDISIVVEIKMPWKKIKSLLEKSGGSILQSVELQDAYRGKEIVDGKHALTIRMTFCSPDRTLTSEEVDEKVVAATKASTKELNASIR